MPFYEYVCQDCRRRLRLFFSYNDYGTVTPVCPHCQSQQLTRRIGRVALGKSANGRSSEDAMDNFDMPNFDENDPKAIGQFMRRMSAESGEDLGDEFGEVVDRLEHGEHPDDIEKSLPNLADNSMGGSSLGGGFDDDF